MSAFDSGRLCGQVGVLERSHAGNAGFLRTPVSLLTKVVVVERNANVVGLGRESAFDLIQSS